MYIVYIYIVLCICIHIYIYRKCIHMKYTGDILNNAIPDQKLKPKILSHFTMFAIVNDINF